MPVMSETIRDFRSLIVYQRAKEMVNEICRLSDRSPLRANASITLSAHSSK